MMVFRPDPFAAQVERAEVDGETAVVRFRIRDAGHRDSFNALFDRAVAGGYGVEVRLLHYYGEPDARRGAAARKAGQRVGKP